MSLIAEIRLKLSADASALDDFNVRLLDRGWVDVYASRYEKRRWTVRDEMTYRVRAGFPRIVESDVVAGVGDISYLISLAACSTYAVNVSEMLASLLSIDVVAEK